MFADGNSQGFGHLGCFGMHKVLALHGNDVSDGSGGFAWTDGFGVG